MDENDIVFLLYRSDRWMSTSSMELIGVFNNDEALSETVRDELRRITHECNDFDPAEWGVRKCFGKWVKKELEAEFQNSNHCANFIERVEKLQRERQQDREWLTAKSKEDTGGDTVTIENAAIFAARKQLAAMAA